ncbi:sigma 54-interacting transcriptional regulator [Myxococcota bacterium]|nr:sigma 54-interacting transcriptional regulator [Myxococcota bacterium]
MHPPKAPQWLHKLVLHAQNERLPVVHVPGLDLVLNCSFVALARWIVWRTARAAQGSTVRRCSLLAMSLDGLPREEAQRQLSGWLELCRGSWLALDLGWETKLEEEALVKEARAHDVRLILFGDHAPVREVARSGHAADDRLDPEAMTALLREIELVEGAFVVATDPTLARVHQSALACVGAGKFVRLCGAPGRGRGALALAVLCAASREEPWVVAPGTPDDAQLKTTSPVILRDLDLFGADELQVTRALFASREELSQLHSKLGRQQGVSPPRPAALSVRIRASLQAELVKLAEALCTTNPTMLGVLAKLITAGAMHSRSWRDATPMLLSGEPGVGKSHLAKELHKVLHPPDKSDAPLVVLDLASISRELYESELFGIENNIASSVDGRVGKLEAASSGLLFIDEVGLLSLEQQRALLHPLQERSFWRIGAEAKLKKPGAGKASARDEPSGTDKPSAPKKIEVQALILLGTNANLDVAVKNGMFRADLRDRLGTQLVIPPLRERPEDILPLAKRFYLAGEATPEGFDWIEEEAAKILLSWRWPGNVRELQTLMLDARRQRLEDPDRAEDDLQLKVSQLGVLARYAELKTLPPVIATVSSASAELELPVQTQQALHGVSLDVLAMGERQTSDGERVALRHALLAAFYDRPVSKDAIQALERQVWAGDLRELMDVADVLRRSRAPLITRAVIRDELPTLLQDEQGSSLLVVLQPRLGRDGEVTGTTVEVAAAAALLGRGGAWEHLQRYAEDAPDEELQRRLGVIAQLARPHVPKVIDLLSPGVSRASVLILRSEQRIKVHTFKGVRHTVWAAAMGSAPQELQQVLFAEPADLGAIGLIELRDERGALIVQLAVATGANTLREHAAGLSARLTESARATEVPREEESPAQEVTMSFELSEEAYVSLGEVLVKATTLLREEKRAPYWLKDYVIKRLLDLERKGNAAVKPVRLYLTHDERFSQNLSRLYESGRNGAAQVDLARRLIEAGAPHERLKVLPKGLQKELTPLIDATLAAS